MPYSKIVLKFIPPTMVLEGLYEVGTRRSNHRPVSDYYEHKLQFATPDNSSMLLSIADTQP